MLGSFIHREQYSLDLIPFDGDLLSMESESAFKVGTHLVLEGKRDVVLCWMLVLLQQLAEGLWVTCTARKGLAEQTWLDPEAWTSLCAFTLNAEGTVTELHPVPPASAAGGIVTNGASPRLKALSCHKEPAGFVLLHSQGALCDGSHCTELH